MNESAQAFQRLVHSRRSIRRFEAEDIDPEVLQRVLASACRAPSAHNRQPWRFAVVPRGKQRLDLVEAMSAIFRADLERDRLPPARIEELVARGRRRLEDPPVVVIICLTMEDMDSYPDEKRNKAERDMGCQSVALAGGYMLLAAHAEGLGGCWICAPLFVPDVIREQLDLPPQWEPQAAIILGHPAEAGRERPRAGLGEIVVWR